MTEAKRLRSTPGQRSAGGADLVDTHQPRVNGHISGDYGGQPASDPNWLFLLHGQPAPTTSSFESARRQSGL